MVETNDFGDESYVVMSYDKLFLCVLYQIFYTIARLVGLPGGEVMWSVYLTECNVVGSK